MTIQRTYNTSAPYIPTAAEDPSDGAAVLRLLAESPLDFHTCQPCDDGSIVIISAGGGMGDILDTSNAVALTELAASWTGAHVHHGMYDYTSVCIEPSLWAPEDEHLIDMLDTARSFADYPILDESDYSERELAAFTEEFAWNTSRLYDGRDETHPLYAKAGEVAMDLYYGYSDPGYISIEHVERCWRFAADDSAREFQNCTTIHHHQ
ncbi:hypothetical protein [Frigoribacterium sp. CG_9.8]|uniref:hypothetical protein n=1 Tax=Frigoribacterium sp. CG_9.8 TaxID=2787733 RepID=UPI0018C90CC9|nr:hypothetical protein [Frigoribacterium sp. CG_9.8]MBG6106578.1 hypothetical protein [Frigoribacterium sp. CG_9.8]